MQALKPHIDAGHPIIGLEPSCLFALRDEFPSLLPGDETKRLAESAVLLEEYLLNEKEARRLSLKLNPQEQAILLHGHCHQKSFATMDSVVGALELIPEARVETVQSSCCGMAGAYGYGSDTYEMSMAMAELSLLPSIRAADDNTVLATDGFSCRHQIEHGTGRSARHVAQILDDALAEPNAMRG